MRKDREERKEALKDIFFFFLFDAWYEYFD